MLVAALLLIIELPNYEADLAANRRTLTVRLGLKRAILAAHAAMLFPFLWVAVMVIAGAFPAWTLLSFLSFPFVVQAWRVSNRSDEDRSGTAPAGSARAVAAFFLHVAFSVLLAVGLLLG